MMMAGAKLRCLNWEYPIVITSVKSTHVFDLIENAPELLPPVSYEKASGEVLLHEHTPIWQTHSKAVTA